MEREARQFNPTDTESWQSYGNCVDERTGLFFSMKKRDIMAAKKICSSCVVRELCLEYALANDEGFGVWGGMSVEERKALKTSRAFLAIENEVL